MSVDLLPGAAPLVTIPGNASSFDPALSADGRYAAFVSAASNLVVGDTNGANDVFVNDLQTGAVSLVTTVSPAVQANASSRSPSISADGRYVAFESDATNLVAHDINNSTDVFVKDLQSGVIVRASTDRTGSEAGGISYDPSISDDGRYVAFTSDAEDLVGGDTNNDTDVFVKDLQTGAIARASTDSSGVQGNDNSSHARLSGGGRFVAFESVATNLVSGDTNQSSDVFVKDLQTGAVARASVDRTGSQADGSSADSGISADGRYVTFVSYADNLVPADTNAHNDLFVKDMQTGTIVRSSTDRNGNQANSNSADAAISPGGRYAAFVSGATNLVPADTNAADDVFVKDLQTGHITRADTDSQGRQGNGTAWSLGTPSLSADGRYVAFSSDASNLAPGDTNGVADVFVKDLQTGAITLVSGVVSTPHQSTPGLYDPVASVWYLRNSFTTGFADATFGFGAPGAGWRPVTGDWNGDGVDTVGLYDPAASLFYLRDTNTGGMADIVVPYGPPSGGWRPVAGDWNGDGKDSVGLYDTAASTWYLADSLTAPLASYVFGFGPPAAGWTPLAGDWNVDRTDTVGLYDPSAAVWYLTDAHGAQNPSSVGFGSPGSGWLPVVGDWDGQASVPALAASVAAGKPVSSAEAAAVDQIDLATLAQQELQPLLDAKDLDLLSATA